MTEPRSTTAAEFISGRFLPRSMRGEGLNAYGKVEDGIALLSEDIIIKFSDKTEKKYYATDKMSVDFLYDEIKSQVDFLNTGTRLRPVYSPPTGYLNRDKNYTHATIYVFKLESLVKRSAQLPFYLFVSESKKNDHVRILARNIQVQLGKDRMMEFAKDKCTVEEVLYICEDTLKKENEAAEVPKYRNTDPSGFLQKTASGGYVFDLVDILAEKAQLPIGVSSEYERITEDVTINVGTERHKFSKWDVTSKVEFWKEEVGQRSTPPYGFFQDIELKDSPKTFRIDDIIGNKASLPVTKGYLLTEAVIVRFKDNSERLFKKNTLLGEVLSSLMTLYSMANCFEVGYPNPMGKKRIFERHIFGEKIDQPEETVSERDMLIGFKDHVRSVVVLAGLTQSKDIVERYKNIVTESNSLRDAVHFSRV